MQKRRLFIFVLSALLAVLSGCSLATNDELYALPKLSGDYYYLQEKLDIIRMAGGEYSAPLSGRNVQSVQLHDLDGDGVQEAVAFFRFSNDEKPLKVYIFKKLENEQYEQIALIEGEGSAFNSVQYENLLGNEKKELILTWQIGSTSASSLHNLTVHRLNGEDATEVMRTSYNYVQILDVDQDGLSELVVIQYDSSGENTRAELYSSDHETMQLTASVPLSRGITELSNVRTGSLRDYVPAVFVYSKIGEGYVTDVLAMEQGSFQNITVDEEIGISLSTATPTEIVKMRDINSDGIMELPFPYLISIQSNGDTETSYYGIQWRQLDSSGSQYLSMSSYHNVNDSWYLTMPSEWYGQIAITRDDSILNVRTVSFTYMGGEEEQVFLKIYKLTGSNRETSANSGARFPLYETTTTIYAAEIIEGVWDSQLNQESLLQAFHMIEDEWQ